MEKRYRNIFLLGMALFCMLMPWFDLKGAEDGIATVKVKALGGRTIEFSGLDLSSCTVGALKQMIFDKESIPIEQQKLIYAGKQLGNTMTLRSYNIKNENTVHLVVEPTTGEGITVKTLTGKEIRLDGLDLSSLTVKGLKQKICETEGIPVRQQRFIYGGKVLEDGNTVQSYGIRDTATINLVLSLSGFDEEPGKEPGKGSNVARNIGGAAVEPTTGEGITVKTLTGKKIRLDGLDLSSLTVKGLKQMILAKEDIPIEQQKLVFNGKALEDDDMILADCFIRSDSTVYLLLRLPSEPASSGPVKALLVEALTGKTILLCEAGNKDMASLTIKQLKKKIQEKEDIPVGQQKLVYAGKQLEDDCTVQSCGIEDNATIHLSLKLSGFDEGPGKRSNVARNIGGAAVAVAFAALIYKSVQWYKARRAKQQSTQATSSEQDQKQIVAALVEYLTTISDQTERDEAIALLLKPYDTATQESLLAEARAQMVINK